MRQRLLSIPENEEIRFWQKVKKTDYCWWWTSSKTPDGYGLFTTKPYGKGKVYAHRWSYKYHFKKDPGELFVCHKCDNPSCVRPGHFFLGTCKDNVRDYINKGRKDITILANFQRSKTHCAQGHEYNIENTYIFGPKKYRSCKICCRAKSLKSYYLRKLSKASQE